MKYPRMLKTAKGLARKTNGSRRPLLSGLMMISFIACSSSYAVDDRTAHFGLSALFGAGAETVLHYNTDLKDVGRVAAGTVLGTLPGLAKEIADSQKSDNEFSQSDLVADVAGAFTGALLSNLVNNAIQVRVETDGEKQVSLLLTGTF